jgi:uncharacterized membrane protein HdeD (DUF308 family)
MSVMSGAPNIGEAIHTMRGKWGWIVALGVFFVIAGIIALGSVFLATIVSVLWVGVMMLVAGIMEIVSAFQMKTWGRFFLWILLGVLYAVAGFLVFDNPLLAAATLTLLLGAALIASGLVRIYLAFQMQQRAPWGWVAFSGALTTLLGIIILIHWPLSSLYVLGLFLGIDLIFAGVGWISMGMALRPRS